MTSASTLFAIPYRDVLTAPTFSLEFDSTRTINYSGATTPTEHPIEDGAEITDHSINRPDEVELSGLIANSPIVILGTLRAQPSVSGGSPRTRAQDAYEAVEAARKSAVLVNLSTEWRDYDDMQIIAVMVTRSAVTGDALDISVRLKRFQRATVLTAALPEEPEDSVHKRNSKRGRQQLEEASPEVEEKSQSLQSLFASIAGAF